MRLPAYPRYMDSGVEWLGEVPEHWTVHPLKRAIAKIESGTSVNASDYPATPGSYGVLKTSCVYTGQFDWKENKTVDNEDLHRVSCPLKIDTLVVSRMNTPDLVGATGLVTEAPNGIFLPDRLWQIYLERRQSPSFIFYFTKSSEYREQVKIACSGTSSSMQNLGQDDFRSLLFVEPPTSEQTQIARFLDHETARIDALIEEQQRLIELLKEKRQAIISHAATKGLDPKVSMKDSGVEWLGEVPVHWKLTAVKYVVESMSQGWSPQCDNYPAEDGEWGVLKVGCVNGGIFNPAENKRLPDELEPDPGLAIKQSDLLISRANTRELVGSAAVAVSDYPWLMLCDKLYRLRLNAERVAPEFLALYLGSSAPRSQIELAASGASDSMQNISQSVVMDMPLPLPPVGEQEAILRLLSDTLKCSDELVAEVTIQRCLLQERRSALISAAVTGKIDVRGWQPPASAISPELAQEAV